MSEPLIKLKEGHQILLGDASIICPSPEACDVRENEPYEAYVERHCYDHGMDIAFSENAEFNLGLRCFYNFHKYIWVNPELTPFPFWELHAFIAEPEWNIDDLEQNVPMAERTFRLPPANERRKGETRQMKQVEVPRQCEKTSIGARAHTVFEHLGEYFLNDNPNFRTIIRSATGKNTRDTLTIIRRMSTNSPNIRRLYGTFRGKCLQCLTSWQNHVRPDACPTCGWENIRVRRISVIDPTKGEGAFGADMVLFRWLTGAQAADAIAPYSVWVAGLNTETTGQRPDHYKWDDPQTDKNSRSAELRAKLIERFDDSVRQTQFGGNLTVFDTRKFVDDFAGRIREEPLRSDFFSLHRKVRWPVDEPENSPYVVDGYRYYFPIKGNGEAALDAKEVAKLERQMSERNFSAEYMNEPLDPLKSLFKRENFKIIAPEDAPIEVTYGLGANLTPIQQDHLNSLNLRIFSYNSCDPAGKEEQSVRGDDTFIVGLRIGRYGAVYITYLDAGKWASSKVWDAINKANNYNRPEFTDYELPASELHVRSSFEKWCRDRTEAIGAPVMLPVRWSHMPKSTKHARIEAMEEWTRTNGRGFFILSNAASPELIEKYISQWINYLVSSHDDGPDATSRLIKWLMQATYLHPENLPAESAITVDANGTAHVPVLLIKEMAPTPEAGGLWGQVGW